ncbi:MAG: class I SAM-dependent DNA methyltransferase [Schwartzia sp.]|nr:class I SAM-dependent DNA methyltransferase [Schwartzia sp. (in: firmicutes)]
MKEKEQKAAAKKFAETWKGRGYEKGETHSFWIELLRTVYGVANPENFITFEEQVQLSHKSFIDAAIPETHVMIEQKSLGKDLSKTIKQSDGTTLTPYQQAKRYAAELPYSKRPRWIVACNFAEFRVYDMETPQAEPEIIKLENLEKEFYRLQFLVNVKSRDAKKEMEISLAAGEIVGKLYDALLKQYKNPESEESLKSLNKLCVRLVFCLYAEDAGIFGTRNMFHDYLKSFREENVRRALIDLFEVLATPTEKRDPYMKESLAAFPYVNGGLFEDVKIEIPNFTDEILNLLLQHASEDFDWSGISPTIFGAVFESTLNPETRRAGGMHYTSIENIHKVIDPLFLDDLKKELETIKETKQPKTRKQKLKDFQGKLASLTFLDPASGSGNFLTETYISLRRLENEALKEQLGVEIVLGELHNPIQVSIGQFYGIEINDFAVTVAKTALWIAEAQMMEETENIVHMNLDFLPLKSYANIVEGNALTLDWGEVVPRDKVDYIMGNPPFVGARLMNAAQKADVNKVFDGWKNNGNLDYVACWYKKAADFIAFPLRGRWQPEGLTDEVLQTSTKTSPTGFAGPPSPEGRAIRAALVSTNSITQGDAVATLWKPLFDEGVHIDFAHRTFRWDSESNSKAHVHCAIVGFSTAPNEKARIIYAGEQGQIANNINAYLMDADDVFVESRQKPLCDVPEIGIGNKPIDDGNYLFTKEEMEAFIAKEPAAAKFFKPWYGSQEFINRKPRYCLWLGDCPPNELRKLPLSMERVEAVRAFRLKSKSAGTRKLADRPTRFHVENMPQGNYIVIPKVSSERRRYIPIGYMDSSVLASDLVFLIPNATFYHLGVLTSNVHNAWVRTVCGRLKSDYRYSKDIVYNNFPWPAPTDVQKQTIEQTAQAILDARAKYPDASLADLYDETTMPPELRKAHQANDRAVMQAYGFDTKISEAECVAKLMERYRRLAERSESESR